MYQHPQHKGFTLVELLVVIGVLAVLATVTVLIVNPSEYLNRAKDSQRVSDLTTVKKAVELAATYKALKGEVLDYDGPNYNPGNPSCVGGGSQKIFISVPTETETAHSPPSGWTYQQQAAANINKIDGNGWLPIDFAGVFTPQSPPVSKLPIDPVNTFSSGYYYSYVCGSFKLSAQMSSQKFKENALNDGGNWSAYYEIGAELSHFSAIPPPYAPENTETLCTDGFDNDGNGKKDTEELNPGNSDPGCANFGVVIPPTPAPTVAGPYVDSVGSLPIPPVNQGSGPGTGYVIGTNFSGTPTVQFVHIGSGSINPGITINAVTPVPTKESTALQVDLTITSSAKSGNYYIKVTNSDGKFGTCNTSSGCFAVNQVQQSTGLIGATGATQINGTWVNTDFLSDDNPPTGQTQMAAARVSLGNDAVAKLTFSGSSFTTIPSGSTITGICVLVNDVSKNTSDLYIQKWNVSLSGDSGSNYTTENTLMSNIPLVISSGTNYAGGDSYFNNHNTTPNPSCASSGTWNKTWTADEFKNGTFAVKMRGSNTGGANVVIRFDVVKINVYFVTP